MLLVCPVSPLGKKKGYKRGMGSTRDGYIMGVSALCKGPPAAARSRQPTVPVVKGWFRELVQTAVALSTNNTPSLFLQEGPT